MTTYKKIIDTLIKEEIATDSIDFKALIVLNILILKVISLMIVNIIYIFLEPEIIIIILRLEE